MLLLSLFALFCVRALGCKFHGSRQQLESHLETCVFEQIQEYVQQTNDKIGKLEETIAKQHGEIRLLKKLVIEKKVFFGKSFWVEKLIISTRLPKLLLMQVNTYRRDLLQLMMMATKKMTTTMWWAVQLVEPTNCFSTANSPSKCQVQNLYHHCLPIHHLHQVCCSDLIYS